MLNHTFKVLKSGQAVGENAKGNSGTFGKVFGKAALAIAIATVGVSSANADLYVIDPAQVGSNQTQTALEGY